MTRTEPYMTRPFVSKVFKEFKLFHSGIYFFCLKTATNIKLNNATKTKPNMQSKSLYALHKPSCYSLVIVSVF